MKRILRPLLALGLASCATPNKPADSIAKDTQAKIESVEINKPESTKVEFIPPHLGSAVDHLVDRCGPVKSVPVLMRGSEGGPQINPHHWAFIEVPIEGDQLKCIEEGLSEVGSDEEGRCFGLGNRSHVPNAVDIIFECPGNRKAIDAALSAQEKK